MLHEIVTRYFYLGVTSALTVGSLILAAGGLIYESLVHVAFGVAYTLLCGYVLTILVKAHLQERARSRFRRFK